MTRRLGIIDLWKFVFSILLVLHHINFVLFPFDYFGGCWIYTEFFFIITGYFTMSHFSNDTKYTTLEDKAKAAISYTANKFRTFLPYTIPFIIIQNAIECYISFRKTSEISSISYLINTVLDLLMIGDGKTTPSGPLWFLFAMFMVFPIFTIICQTSYKHLLYIISFFISVFWCHYTNVVNNTFIRYTAFPYYLFRAFIFLMLGTLVHGMVIYIRKINFKKYGKSYFQQLNM